MPIFQVDEQARNLIIRYGKKEAYAFAQREHDEAIEREDLENSRYWYRVKLAVERQS